MVLVLGSTGRMGDRIVRRLLEQGRQVKILVQPGSDYLSLVQAGAHPVLGGLGDPQSLLAAVHGIDMVIIVHEQQASGEVGYGALIDLATSAGARRIICTPPSNEYPAIISGAEIEQHLRAKGLPYRIWRSETSPDAGLHDPTIGLRKAA